MNLFRIAAMSMMALNFLALGGDVIKLYQYPFDVTQGEPDIPQNLRLDPELRRAEYFYKIVHLSQPMRAETRLQMESNGMEILNYLADNAYLVRVTDEQSPRAVNAIDWSGDYHPAYKIHPAIGLNIFRLPARIDMGFVLHVVLHPGSDMAVNRSLIQELNGEILDEVKLFQIRRFEVRFSGPEVVTSLAKLDDVAWIAEKGQRDFRNDRTRWIIQSHDDPNNVTMATPLYDRGLRGEGEIVGIIDGTMDLNHCLFTDAANANAGPTHRKVVYLDAGGFISSHGTHVAGSVAGLNENGSMTTAGIAHNARIAFTASIGNQSGQLLNVLTTHMGEGARIHTNSWGEVDGTAQSTDYSTDCVDIDTFMYNNEDHLVLFASMNGGLNSTPLLSPENAVNVLAVGASGAGTNQPQLLAEQHGSCRRGPTVVDGRRKPELFSPGCSTESAQSGSSCGTGFSCGTSMAAPATAGGMALVRQYFREGFYPTGAAVPGDSMIPSGALMKAVVLNGTVNMTDESNGTDLPIPNDVEGWGRTNLDRSLFFNGDAAELEVVDIRNSSGLSTGQTGSHQVSISSGSVPFRVTLVFTAPPSFQGTNNPVINDLDLRVTTPEDVVFLGNVWTNGASVSGGSADAINNVEQVLINNPTPGSYLIEVLATAVNMNDQGYALAITADLQALACNADADAGNGQDLACWGDSIMLQGSTSLVNPAVVNWEPSAGLSDPATLTPMATPTETTTYTLTVGTSQACVATSQVTVTVPEMDIDGNQALNLDDALSFIGNYWNQEIDAGNQSRDFNQNGFLQITDILQLMGCLP